VARALIVGCGCRGRALAARLRSEGWEVRGTSRDRRRLAEIEAAGAEAVIADPDRGATVLDAIVDVTVVLWLLASAAGGPEAVSALHGPRLERLLEKLVDSPVRGFLYEAAGSVDRGVLGGGARIVRAAAERWRIPVEIVAADPADAAAWVEAMAAATERLIGAPTR
jgi:uncharacterized protein YbjT (DUF2867 family)